jgi:putative ABC transport system substrate-binding protein
MRRIVLAVLFTVGVALAPSPTVAQQGGKIPRIGVLSMYSPEDRTYIWVLRDGLRARGFVEGQNITIEWRWARGNQDRLPALAAELVQLRVDVLVTESNPTVQAAQAATKTIPIVMTLVSDPVGLGFITSLARPGGNTTGLSLMIPDLMGKLLELLKEAVPKIHRVAILTDVTFPGIQLATAEVTDAAARAGLQAQNFDVRSPSDFDGAFAAMGRQGVGGIVTAGSPMFSAHIARIAELATKGRLPMVSPAAAYARAGLLLGYGPIAGNLAWRAAYFVDRILKGTRPADLPVEQPRKFELAINRKTAKTLGLTIPQSLLVRADEIIQ